MGAGRGLWAKAGPTRSPTLRLPSPAHSMLNLEQVRLGPWAARHALARPLRWGASQICGAVRDQPDMAAGGGKVYASQRGRDAPTMDKAVRYVSRRLRPRAFKQGLPADGTAVSRAITTPCEAREKGPRESQHGPGLAVGGALGEREQFSRSSRLRESRKR